MTRNIIIILVSLGIVVWNLFVFKRRATFSKSTRIIALVMLALWVITTFLPNIPILLSPLSPTIHGKVIDAETKQPIANCNIKSYWQTETFFVAGGHWEAYKSFYTKTNSQGEFTIPRYQKTLGVYVVYPYILTRYSGVEVVAYDHGHKYKEIGVSTDDLVYDSYTLNERTAQSVSKIVIVKMLPIKDPVLYFQNLFDLDLQVFSQKNYQWIMPEHFKEFIVSSYDYLNANFPNLNCELLNNAELYRFSKLIEDTGDIQKAIEVQEKRKKVCPSEAKSAIEEIIRLQMENKRKVRQ